MEIDEHKFPAALRHAIGFSRVVALDAAAKSCAVEFVARDEFTHSGGTTVQGGIVTAWIDHAMAWAVHAHDTKLAVASLELKATYIARVKPGKSVVEAKAIRIGKRVAFLEARVLSESGDLLATASSSAMIL